MKNTVLLSILIAGMATGLSAQENKVVSAKMYFDEYVKDADTSSLKDAKTAIDLAAANDKTRDEPKMWLYRGTVYRAVYEQTLNNIVKKATLASGKPSSKEALMKLTSIGYANTDTTNICIATFSFLRVIQLVPKDYYADEARQMLPVCAAHIENKATTDFGNGNYASALAMFERALVIGQVQGLKDTADFMVQNIQNAAIAADKLHNTAKALFYYQKLVDMKVGGAQPYSAIIAMYNAAKDTAKSMAMLKKARAAFPSDVNLLISETNVYLQAHNTEKAISNLQTAIDQLNMQNKPENNTLLANLYFVLGNTYDRMANPKTDSGKALPRPANYDDLFSKAEANYTKSVTLTPDNFDVLFDLGALYNNSAIEINRKANELPIDATDKFNKLQAQANDMLKKAQPWLEKAHAVNPKDQATVTALLNIYAGTGQVDKIKPLKEGK